MSPARFRELFVGILIRPLDTLMDVGDDDTVHGGVAVGLAGVLWTLLSSWLALDGQKPSGPTLLVGAEHHYLVQAALLLPLLLVAWKLFGFFTAQLARRLGGEGDGRALEAALGLTLGVPLLVLFVIPDLVMYAVGGFLELGFLLPLTGPVTALWIALLSVSAVRAIAALSWSRAFAASALGFLPAALLLGLFVR